MPVPLPEAVQTSTVIEGPPPAPVPKMPSPLLLLNVEDFKTPLLLSSERKPVPHLSIEESLTTVNANPPTTGFTRTPVVQLRIDVWRISSFAVLFGWKSTPLV